MIELKNISKTFKVAKRNAGLKEAVRSLFKKEYSYINALTDVSFGGSREGWELLLHGKTLTVECKNGELHTPRVTFLDIKPKG